MAPFESHYGRRFMSTIGWLEVGVVSLVGPELFHEFIEEVKLLDKG